MTNNIKLPDFATDFKPLGRVTDIEVHPVVQWDTPDGQPYCEICEPNEAHFFSVYVRYDPKGGAGQGVDCIADFETEQQANDYAGIMEKIYITA